MTVSAPLGGVGGSRMVMPRAVRSVVARAEPRVTERVCWPPSSVLAKSDVARFIEVTMGHTTSEGLITVVHLETDGNLLFVSELARLLAHEGGLERVGDTVSWRVSLPQGIKQVIRRASPALRTRTVASF